MTIEDIEIKIKKFDREKNYVLVNLLILNTIEIRGFVVRYTKTRYTVSPIWIVNPPSIPSGKKGKYKIYFWVVEFKDPDFWEQLQQKIIHAAVLHTNIP